MALATLATLTSTSLRTSLPRYLAIACYPRYMYLSTSILSQPRYSRYLLDVPT